MVNTEQVLAFCEVATAKPLRLELAPTTASITWRLPAAFEEGAALRVRLTVLPARVAAHARLRSLFGARALLVTQSASFRWTSYDGQSRVAFGKSDLGPFEARLAPSGGAVELR